MNRVRRRTVTLPFWLYIMLVAVTFTLDLALILVAIKYGSR